MRILLILAVLAWAAAWNLAQIPLIVLQKFGIGCRKVFEIDGRQIRRPKHFRSGAHKRAFAAAGERITNAINWNFMENIGDEAIAQDTGLLFGKARMAPPEVWREVLAWYAEQGCIVPRWQLGLPLYGKAFHTPQWRPDGTSLFEFNVWNAEDVPDPSIFCPNLLTDEQREALLGSSYRTSPNDSSPGTVTLDASNFRRIYFRPRRVISTGDLRKGGNAVARGLAVAAAMKR